MSKVVWDEVGSKLFEAGASQGVLYPQVSGKYPKGVAWSGLTAVNEKPSGAEPKKVYADDINYLTLTTREEYKATIEAIYYPDEFNECNGSVEITDGVRIGQQSRKPFGFSYKTKIGNDAQQLSYAYVIHLVYNALAAPSERAHGVINEDTEVSKLSWEISTTPVPVAGHEPTATIEIDSRKFKPEIMKKIETILYGKDPTTSGGNDGVEPRLPLPDEVYEILKATTPPKTPSAGA